MGANGQIGGFYSGRGGGENLYDKYGNNGASSGIHIGILDQTDYNKDHEQNRNIDMAELHELLGN